MTTISSSGEIYKLMYKIAIRGGGVMTQITHIWGNKKIRNLERQKKNIYGALANSGTISLQIS